jgi:hypothetical protein
MRISILLFTAMFGLSAFAATKMEVSPDNKLEVKGLMTMTVAWVKDKTKKFDVDFTIKNESDKSGIIVYLQDMGCARGDTSGQLKHTFFNTGERTIDFRAHQQKHFSMVCDLGGEVKSGTFKINITKVYDNPSMDGKTTGKILASDLTWSQADKK